MHWYLDTGTGGWKDGLILALSIKAQSLLSFAWVFRYAQNEIRLVIPLKVACKTKCTFQETNVLQYAHI